MSHLFCFGLGYSAREFSDALIREGWRVSGTCRTESDKEQLEGKGYQVCLFDGKGPGPEVPGILKTATHVLISIPPSDEGDPVLKHHAQDLKSMVGISWLGYLSTTGVYGDQQGDWVDETTSLSPSTERGQRRAFVEAQWQEFSDTFQLPLHRFRLAAIYGPGRNALVRIPKGKAPIVDVPGLYFSRIHVEDLVQILIASIAQPRAGAIYNVADDLPQSPAEVLRYAYQLLGKKAPEPLPLEEAGLSEMGKSFYQQNKRVANALVKEELGISLKYPSYREGLSALLDSQD